MAHEAEKAYIKSMSGVLDDMPVGAQLDADGFTLRFTKGEDGLWHPEIVDYKNGIPSDIMAHHYPVEVTDCIVTEEEGDEIFEP
jgi:hypothetical protein